MRYKRYKGPVLTLEQASFDDFPVRITCQKCGHFRQMHAFEALRKLSNKRKEEGVKLWQSITGVFRCRCKHRTVKITAPLQSVY